MVKWFEELSAVNVNELYEYACAYAKALGCYNLTLNVWALNDGAQHFYEKMGMKVQKIGMEIIF